MEYKQQTPTFTGSMPRVSKPCGWNADKKRCLRRSGELTTVDVARCQNPPKGRCKPLADPCLFWTDSGWNAKKKYGCVRESTIPGSHLETRPSVKFYGAVQSAGLCAQAKKGRRCTVTSIPLSARHLFVKRAKKSTKNPSKKSTKRPIEHAVASNLITSIAEARAVRNSAFVKKKKSKSKPRTSKKKKTSAKKKKTSTRDKARCVWGTITKTHSDSYGSIQPITVGDCIRVQGSKRGKKDKLYCRDVRSGPCLKTKAGSNRQSEESLQHLRDYLNVRAAIGQTKQAEAEKKLQLLFAENPKQRMLLEEKSHLVLTRKK